MTPAALAKSNSEHGHQRALFAWLNMAERHGFAAAWDEASYSSVQSIVSAGIPELKWCHAIPNGGSRGDDAKSRARTGALLKAEGVKPGIPDVFLPVPLWGKVDDFGKKCITYAGLYVEMKRPKAEGQRAGNTSDEQDGAIAWLRHFGYAVSVCFDWVAAARDIQAYIEAVRKGA